MNTNFGFARLLTKRDSVYNIKLMECFNKSALHPLSLKEILKRNHEKKVQVKISFHAIARAIHPRMC